MLTTPSPPRPPQPVIDERPHCWRCDRALCEYAARPWSIRCRRCKAQNKSKDEGQ